MSSRQHEAQPRRRQVVRLVRVCSNAAFLENEQLALVDEVVAGEEEPQHELRLELQADLVARRRAGEIADTLVLLQHPHVITLGSSSDPANVLVDEAAHEQQIIWDIVFNADDPDLMELLKRQRAAEVKVELDALTERLQQAAAERDDE